MTRRHMLPSDVSLLRWAQDAQLSPDASRLAWRELSVDEAEDRVVSQLMVAAADGRGEPRPFTEGPADLLPRWSPDGCWIAYLAAADGPPALRLAPLDGGAPERVEAPGAVGWLEWSPSGDRLALGVTVPDRRPPDSPQARNAPRVVRGLTSRLDGAGWKTGRTHVFVYDLATRVLRQLTKGDYDYETPSWSPDGERLVVVADRSGERDRRRGYGDVWVMSASGGRLQRLTRGVGGAALPNFSPDGSRVAFIGTLHLDDQTERDSRLLVVAADGSGSDGPGSCSVLAPALDRPVGVTLGPGRPYAWLSADELVFNVVEGGTVGISRGWTRGRGSTVVSGPLQVMGLSVAGEGRRRRIAYEAAWADQPGEIFVSSLAGASPVRVSRAVEPLAAAADLLPVTSHRAVAPDGLEIEYFVMSPPQRRGGGARRRPASAPPPLFLDIHGGPSFYNPISQGFAYYQVLAAAGYAVVLPNPRGGIGYGEGFRRLLTGRWGSADLPDLEACCDDAIARGLADGARQFVGGYSYGGYMTSWVVGHSNRFRAAIVGAPIVDALSMFGTSDVGFSLPTSLGADPWKAPEKLLRQSPLTYAADVTTPVLLHVNEGDLRCPPSQTDEWHVALVWLRKQVEYVRYPGGSHEGFYPMEGIPSQFRDRAERFCSFLAQHGGQPAR